MKGNDLEPTLTMVSDPHFITGIQAGRLPGDQIPLRMEIDDWWFSKDLVHINQRTLFIRALTIWQEKGFAQGKDPDDLSYFGVAGTSLSQVECGS